MELQKCSLFLGFLLSYIFISAQPSITANDFLGLIGSTFMMEEDTSGAITVDVGQPGNDQTWDLSTVAVPNPFTLSREFLDPGETPYSARFAEANLAEKITSMDFPEGAIFNYYAVAEERARNVGSATMATVMGIPFEQFNDDNQLVAPFPVEIGTSWSETIYDTTTQAGVFTNIIFDSTVIRVDGWGKLILPSGEYTCLRLFEQCWNQSKTVISGVSTDSSSESALTYIWVSPEHFILASITSQDGETDPNFTSATSFSRLAGGSSALFQSDKLDGQWRLLGPNPFGHQIRLEVSTDLDQPLALHVYDVMGHLVKTLLPSARYDGTQHVNWNGTDESGQVMPGGTYILSLRSPGTTTNRKVQLVR